MKFRIVRDRDNRYGIQYSYFGLFWSYVPRYGDGSGALDYFSSLESAELFDLKSHLEWLEERSKPLKVIKRI